MTTSWMLVYGAIAVLAGACGPIQATVNGALAADMASGTFATAISVSASAFYLLGSLITSPPSEKGRPGLRLWMFASGVLMPAYVGAIIHLKSYLGIQVIVSGLLCGQLGSAVALDHYGLVASLPIRRITSRRMLGVGLAAVACLLMQLRGQRVPLRLLPLLPVCAIVGASLPVQSAFNGRLASHVGGARRASATVCTIGSAILWLLVACANYTGRLPPTRRPVWELPLWETLGGGLLGLAGIAVLLVGRELGMARYYVLQVSAANSAVRPSPLHRKSECSHRPPYLD